MANVTSQLVLNILSSEDTTSNVPINRSCAPSFDGIAGQYVQYYEAGAVAAPGNIIFGNSGFPQNCLCAYVRNLSPNQSICITFEYAGVGAPLQSVVLGPGGVWVNWNAVNNGPAIAGVTPPITIVYVYATANNTPIEYYFGG